MASNLHHKADQFRAKLIQDIKEDRCHGASELARRALDGLAEYSQLLESHSANEMSSGLIQLAQDLQKTRPSMAPINNLMQLWLDSFSQSHYTSQLSVASYAQKTAQRLKWQSQQAVAAIAQYSTDLIRDRWTVMTHSNSASVRACYEVLSTKNIEAIVTESRPGLEGKQLAKAISSLGITTHYITDAQIGLFVPHADVVMVGADTVLADGSVVNKSGTYLLALAAKANRVPFYVCCESFKLSDLLANTIQLERKATDELNPPYSALISAHNIYFDITPARLITSYITEFGPRLTMSKMSDLAPNLKKKSSHNAYRI